MGRCRYGVRIQALRTAALAVGLLLACYREPVVEVPLTCGPAELAADRSDSALRLDPEEADFSFSGDMPEQVEFVWIRPEGKYHYAERWNWGVAGEGDLQVSLGWDWKHECRIERCDLPNGNLCCFQVCEDGGNSGVAREPPDRFGCMNVAAGGGFQWFLNGLRKAGIEGLEGCFGPAPPRLMEAHGPMDPGLQPSSQNPVHPSDAP